MGKRVEGRKKQKSVKANVTSKFSSKRKLSRMGKKVQAGKMGPNTEFITRSSALRKLQITLKDFRRLCILKGIYPRVPAKGLQGNDKVYYDIKDISYIMHEPLLHKFREFKTFMKKIRRAAGRNQFEEARRQNDDKPKFTLDHLVKERYPRFIDALRDMDDALCMIHLFAALPSSGRITTEHTLTCQRLSREWQYYVAKSQSLRKVFVSVKGVYYQGEVLGEPITWLVPHAFTQSLPREVDYRVMLTFLDFYEVYVRFALYKLYHMKTWQYPPNVNPALEAEGCCLLSLKTDVIASDDVTKTQTNTTSTTTSMTKKKRDLAKIKAIDVTTLLNKNKKNDNSNDDDISEEDNDEEEEEEADISIPLQNAFSDLQSFHATSSSSSTAQHTDNNTDTAGGEEEQRVFTTSSSEVVGVGAVRPLFHGLVFFVNREVPLDWCQLCVTGFGGKIGWEGMASPIALTDPRITHHVIDRPMQGNSELANREYVQPQWIFDCINSGIILPARLYAPGVKLPPHLSPFVNDDKEGYVPHFREEVRKLQLQQQKSSAEGEDEEVDEEEVVQREEVFEEVDDFKQTTQLLTSNTTKKTNKAKKVEEEGSEDSEGSNSDNDSDEEEVEELEEVPSIKSNSKKGPKAIVYQKKESNTPINEEEEAKELSKQMMKKKTKRLYDRMQYGIEKKQEQVQSLLQKRKALDEGVQQEEKKTNTNTKKSKK